MFFAREQPNAALGWGLAAIALVALVVFGIVHVASGSSSSSAAANGGAGGGAQIGLAGGGSSSGSGGTKGSGGSKRSGSTKTARPDGGSSGAGTTSNGGASSATTSGHSSKAPHDTSSFPPTYTPQFPVTTDGPLVPLAPNEQKWVASPSNVHMQAGAFTRGWVIVDNLTDHWGLVNGPGCAGPPLTAPGTAPGSGSCYAGKQFVVQAQSDQKFMWTWHATQTGRAGAPPLAPGSYFFTVGRVNVHVTVK